MLERLLRRGGRSGADAAALAELRALLDDGREQEAQARADALPGETGALAAGIVAARRGFPALARAHLDRVEPVARYHHAAAEHVRAGLALAPRETCAEIAALAAADPGGIGAEAWYEVLTATFGHGDQELARAVLALLDRHAAADPGTARRADSLRPWVAADAGSPTAPAPPGGRRTIAIMDYGHPGADRASANIGDHVQSIAALGHLVRHRAVRLHGEPELTALLDELGERTRPALRRTGVAADVEVMTVHRDASMYQPIPQDTWVLCFGWYMHALFELRHGFPLHANLRPVFVSFHCNKRALLTPAAIAYLRRYGPVGCRDWTTVHLLLSCGVPAFFSGCVTTTIDSVFPELPERPPAGAPAAYVDMPEDTVPAGAVTYAHSDRAVRRRSFVVNARNAVDLLERYRREHSRVVTSRLHCYLPLRALGAAVEFRPRNRSDVRFDGLLGIDDDAFGAIRTGLLEKLEPVHEAILSGRPESEVYALWRELTAADVAAAEQRRSPALELAPVAPATRAALARAVTRTKVARAPAAGAVHCAIAVRKGDARAASVLVASLLAHATRPLHVWLLVRPGTGAIEQRLAARFPEAGFGRVPLRGLGRVSRVAAAQLLPAVGRVVLLPLPALATADVAELADLDLGPHALAAAPRPGTVAASGFAVIHRAAARLGDRTDAAAALRRSAHARHDFDFDAFGGAVLVLDLERFRAQELGDSALALVQELGLRELEALHYLVGPRRAALPDRWAAVPTRTPDLGPGLLHWADDVRPWDEPPTPARERWREQAARLSG